MGRSIYFTKKELGYLWLVLSNIDTSETEEEHDIRQSLYEKVSRASWKVEGGYE